MKKTHYFGTYKEELQAAVAYDEGSLKLKGPEKSKLNFPERHPEIPEIAAMIDPQKLQSETAKLPTP
eukprot:scaffold501608_cov53-Prasinocladus_malaysianus.AAC.1